MKIIKTISELKAGDILVGPGTNPDARQVVVHVGPSAEPSYCILATARFSHVAGHVATDCNTWEGTARRVVVVSDSELTPAQQAADKLLDAAERCLTQLERASLTNPREAMHILRADLQVLLPTLRPKPPPTLDEALTLLRSLATISDAGSEAAHIEKMLAATRDLIARVPK